VWYYYKELMRSVGFQEVTTMPVSAMWRVNSTWCDGGDMPLSYRMKRKGK
jgi:hypothetical protein